MAPGKAANGDGSASRGRGAKRVGKGKKPASATTQAACYDNEDREDGGVSLSGSDNQGGGANLNGDLNDCSIPSAASASPPKRDVAVTNSTTPRTGFEPDPKVTLGPTSNGTLSRAHSDTTSDPGSSAGTIGTTGGSGLQRTSSDTNITISTIQRHSSNEPDSGKPSPSPSSVHEDDTDGQAVPPAREHTRDEDEIHLTVSELDDPKPLIGLSHNTRQTTTLTSPALGPYTGYLQGSHQEPRAYDQSPTALNRARTSVAHAFETQNFTQGEARNGTTASAHQPYPDADNTAEQSQALIPLGNHHGDIAGATRTWPAVPENVRNRRSEHLNRLMSGTSGMGPTLLDLLAPSNFPFVETFTLAKAANNGVVVIRNIPFETTRAEIVAFLGRNSKILNDAQEPVHIIIDRVTSKTKDAYVEFITMQDAMRAVQRHQSTIDRGRTARLGDRPVAVELSSQDALMADLFPHARVQWVQGVPVLVQTKDEKFPWRSFAGFVTEEEMAMLVKHVEQPHRTPFSKDCPQRPYECMISTITKLPWYLGEQITLEQRNAVFTSVLKLMQHLHNAIRQGRHEKCLNSMLLKRLGSAAMSCPGFSVVQKDDISYLSHLDRGRERLFNQPRGANLWTHQLTLGPKERIPMDVIEWYIAFIRDETTRFIMNKPIAERNSILSRGSQTNGYFGFLWYELGLPSGKNYDALTLRQASEMELAAIERIIRRAYVA